MPLDAKKHLKLVVDLWNKIPPDLREKAADLFKESGKHGLKKIFEKYTTPEKRKTRSRK